MFTTKIDVMCWIDEGQYHRQIAEISFIAWLFLATIMLKIATRCQPALFWFITKNAIILYTYHFWISKSYIIWILTGFLTSESISIGGGRFHRGIAESSFIAWLFLATIMLKIATRWQPALFWFVILATAARWQRERQIIYLYS